MAEALAQNWLAAKGYPNWLAVSAGTFAQEGVPTSPKTVEALSRKGIAFEGTSTALTKEMAAKADIILCMSENHLEVVHQYVVEAELLSPEDSIADPIGQDQTIYDELAEQLEKLIHKKLEAIIQ